MYSGAKLFRYILLANNILDIDVFLEYAKFHWTLISCFNFRYTLLVGKPPFETTSLKETYQRIKKNEYYIPARVPQSAQMLIIKMLRPDPCTRPTMKEVCFSTKFL